MKSFRIINTDDTESLHLRELLCYREFKRHLDCKEPNLLYLDNGEAMFVDLNGVYKGKPFNSKATTKWQESGVRALKRPIHGPAVVCLMNETTQEET